MGWERKHVRNEDGRAGVVTDELQGYGFTGLTLKVGNSESVYIELRDGDKVKGEQGWSWLCEDYDGGPKWLPFGTAP